MLEIEKDSARNWRKKQECVPVQCRWYTTAKRRPEISGLQELERGGFTIGGGWSRGIRAVDDLVNRINGFSLTGAAADVKDAGDQLILHASGIGESLKLGFPSGDQSRYADWFATVTADNSAKSFRNYRRCHEIAP